MKLVVKIPQTQQSYQGYTPTVVPQIKSKLDFIRNSFGSIISNASRLTHVPSQLIDSVIFIESSGNPNAISSAGAVGLMGLMPASASSFIQLENMKGRLSDGEKQILTKYLGDRFTQGIMKQKYLGHYVTVNGVKNNIWVTREDLLKPELNVLIGSIYLGLLIAEESKDGVLRLDRIIVRYNKGYRSDIVNGDIEKVLASDLPTETKNYILKLVGKGGVLSQAI